MLIKEYCEIKDKIKNTKNKERKKLQKRLDIIENEKDKNFDKIVVEYQKYKIKMNELEKLKYEKIHLPEIFHTDYKCSIFRTFRIYRKKSRYRI